MYFTVFWTIFTPLRIGSNSFNSRSFIPITAKHLGYTVVEMPVTHRPRVAGTTKYGLGILQRAIPGLIDLMAVRYMRSRRRPVNHSEITTISPAATEIEPGRNGVVVTPAARTARTAEART